MTMLHSVGGLCMCVCVCEKERVSASHICFEGQRSWLHGGITPLYCGSNVDWFNQIWSVLLLSKILTNKVMVIKVSLLKLSCD